MDTIKNIVFAPTMKKVLIYTGVLLIALFIFQVGQYVGLKRAEFSFRMGDNYYRNIEGRGFDMNNPANSRVGGPAGSIGPHFNQNKMTESHGATGKIISIATSTAVTSATSTTSTPFFTITVASPDNVEKDIVVNNKTLIRQFRQSLTAANLKVDDNIVVIGTPNENGQIEAKLVRIIK